MVPKIRTGTAQESLHADNSQDHLPSIDAACARRCCFDKSAPFTASAEGVLLISSNGTLPFVALVAVNGSLLNATSIPLLFRNCRPQHSFLVVPSTDSFGDVILSTWPEQPSLVRSAKALHVPAPAAAALGPPCRSPPASAHPPRHFDPHRSSHVGAEHVDARPNRHLPGTGDPRQLQHLVQPIHQLLGGVIRGDVGVSTGFAHPVADPEYHVPLAPLVLRVQR